MANRGAGLGFHFPFALGFALIMQFFSFGDGQFYLDAAVLQIHLGRNERQPFFASAGLEFLDLGTMQQQFAAAGRLVIFAIAVGILADMSIEQPSLIARHLGEAIFQLDPAASGGFHFRSGEGQAGLKAFQQMIVMPRMTVVAQ